MRDLEAFRDHCRAMANWQPPKPKERVNLGSWCRDLRATWPESHTEEAAPKHEQCTWDWCACECHPRPAKQLGPTDDERALWTRLADEVDAYLTSDEDEGLFSAPKPPPAPYRPPPLPSPVEPGTQQGGK